MLQICLLTPFPKIKFSRIFLDLQYYVHLVNVLKHTIHGSYVQDLTSFLMVRVRLGLEFMFKRNYRMSKYSLAIESKGLMKWRIDSKFTPT